MASLAEMASYIFRVYLFFNHAGVESNISKRKNVLFTTRWYQKKLTNPMENAGQCSNKKRTFGGANQCNSTSRTRPNQFFFHLSHRKKKWRSTLFNGENCFAHNWTALENACSRWVQMDLHLASAHTDPAAGSRVRSLRNLRPRREVDWIQRYYAS